MDKLKMILQLLSDGGSLNRICNEVHCSKSTVSQYKKTAAASNFSYQELLNLPVGELQTIFMPRTGGASMTGRKAELYSMMPEIMKRLERRHANVLFVYEEYYHKEIPDGYGYTQFNKYVQEYCKKNNLVYRNTYEPGQEWQIDFAGDPLYLTDKLTKTRTRVVVLVCVMPYSNLPFMMAMPNATSEWFYQGLNKGLEFMGALPQKAKSDNMKQWVTKSDRYSPTFSDANKEWCDYYDIEPSACRVRQPRDKGAVEGAVNLMYKYIYPRIEADVFYDISALNNRIWELLDEYCTLPFKGSCRWELFNKYEKPNMRPLPEHMYRFRMRKEVKLSNTYHVCVGSERHFYSVPYKYVGQKVKVMWDVEFVEVYVGRERVCIHDRSTVPYGYTTDKAHMPEIHTAYEDNKAQNAATLIERGLRISISVKQVIEGILEQTRFPQQAYGTCNGVLALGKKYGYERLSRACSILVEKSCTPSYRVLRNMLKNNRDLQFKADETTSDTPYNENVRGANAYKSVNPNLTINGHDK